MENLNTDTEVFILDYMGRSGEEVTVDDLMAEAERINSGERYSLITRYAPKARSSISRALRSLRVRGLVDIRRSIMRRGIPEAYWGLTGEGRLTVSRYWREQHAVKVYAPSLFSDTPCEGCTFAEDCWNLEMKRLEAFLQERFGLAIGHEDLAEIKQILGSPSRVKQLIAIYTFYPEIQEAKDRYDALLERLAKKQPATHPSI